jgi:hypothetical protein
MGEWIEQGLRGIMFIGFVAFLGFVGLVKQGSVEDCIPFIDDNSKNTMNYIRVRGVKGSCKPLAISHLIV